MPLALIPTNRVATWLSAEIERFLTHFGLKRGSGLEEVIYTLIILIVAIAIGWMVRRVVIIVMRAIVYRRQTPFVDDLKRQHLIERSSHIIPPLVFLALIPFAFEADPKTLGYIERAVLVYFTIMLGWTICAVLNIIWAAYDRRENVKNLPLRGILNIGKGIVCIVIAIVTVSIIVDRSPTALLTGLGAFAAALMLIFKDSILGFVAGLQLSFNDMLSVGDWIVVPGTIANGIVTDVSLTAVKIRNWDNTTVTMPPYTLVSTSFQNYNKMKERGRRHISDSIYIDVSTVQPLTPDMLETYRKIPYLDGFITRMQQLASQGKATALRTDGIPVNGSIDTNLGLYRAYVGLYLRHHPFIAVDAPDAKCMCFLGQQTMNGIPLQLFCYTNTADWETFEGIQSHIFEHLIAIAPAFGLSAFSLPTTRSDTYSGTTDPKMPPYTGNTPVPMSTYDPRSNFMVPPNTAGDPGIPQHTDTIYPSDDQLKADTAGN